MNTDTAKPASDTLPLEDSTDVLLALLYAPGKTESPGEPIEGRTRIQKLVFLLQEDVGPKQLVDEARELDYSAHKMGPYSKKLAEVLEELEAAGIIKTDRLEYVLTDDSDPDSAEPDIDTPGSGKKRVESLRYRLSDFGLEIAEKIWRGLSDEQKESLSEFKAFFNGLKLRQLLIFTYDRYPDFTTRSIIKEELGY